VPALNLPPVSVQVTNIGDLKLRDLAKLQIFKQIIKKLNFKKISYDVIVVMSSSLGHRKTSPKYRHKIFPFKISGYANVVLS